MKTKLIWLVVALVGATGFAMLALNRGETVNAAWLVLAAVSLLGHFLPLLQQIHRREGL